MSKYGTISINIYGGGVMSYFSDFYAKIKYPISSTESLGLRNAQLGAIHAIAAHATLEPNDASVIVMPTGSGKTTVSICFTKRKSTYRNAKCYQLFF